MANYKKETAVSCRKIGYLVQDISSGYKLVTRHEEPGM